MLVLGYIWLPVRRAADLRLAREPRPAPARGGERPRREPLAGVPAVTLPLVLPGVVAAFLFVFIPTLGEFVTPSLVGGASGYMYGNQIVDLFGTGFPTGRPARCSRSSCSCVVAALTLVFARFLQRGRWRPD